MTIAKRIRIARECRGFTPYELALRMECNTSQVHGWERSQCVPSAKSIVALCRACNVSADWLLGLHEREDDKS